MRRSRDGEKQARGGRSKKRKGVEEQRESSGSEESGRKRNEEMKQERMKAEWAIKRQKKEASAREAPNEWRRSGYQEREKTKKREREREGGKEGNKSWG